jgi:hypothetical protein
MARQNNKKKSYKFLIKAFCWSKNDEILEIFFSIYILSVHIGKCNASGILAKMSFVNNLLAVFGGKKP